MRKLEAMILTLNFCFLGTAYCVAHPAPQSRVSKGLVFSGARGGGPPNQLDPISLPDGRLIVSVGNTVYMIDAGGKQQWKYENETLTSEPAFNSGLNEVAVVMYDLQAVKLDATTGKVKWKSDTVGRGLFTSVHAYGHGFLVLVNMSGYRENGSDVPADRLEYWGEPERESWHVDFPQDAEVVVNGKKVYALRRTADRMYLREIQIPKSSDSSS